MIIWKYEIREWEKKTNYVNQYRCNVWPDIEKGIGAATTAETADSDPTGSPYSINTRAHSSRQIQIYLHCTHTYALEHFQLNSPTMIVHWPLGHLESVNDVTVIMIII